MSKLHYAQLRFLSIILLCWLAVFVVTRSILLVDHLVDVNADLIDLLYLFSIGFIYDLAFLIYAALPLALYLLILPNRWWSQRWHQVLLIMLLGISLYLMLFTAVAEWLFWDEFGVRFNFISVDYLVYSDEVVNNIIESYPIYPLLACLVILAGAVSFLLRKIVFAAIHAPVLPKSHTCLLVIGLALLGGISDTALDQNFPRSAGGNTFQRELASNGPFQFFAAFRNNELDYEQFYVALPNSKMGALIREEVSESNAHFVSNDLMDIRREIDNPGQFKQHNVVLVIIESLSAKYLGSFGNSSGLTPNLDALRKQSLFFNNFYATGTRTTRGLEAITLSIPPTPGRSIVKRPGRESGFSSLGQQFEAIGYDSVFLYGGHGYFDNMTAFFEGNGYRIVDQSSVKKTDIQFANAWGMSDEDIYAQVMKVADADYTAGKPFFLQVMTTSNHRPYTYPQGRIDIPSGDGRQGAVKYTDYAIGQFLLEARKKSWFDNTIFVFVADHTAGSAGKEDLPVANYHIPFFIYAPSLIKAQEFTGLSSQIDLAPTLMSLLNMDYVSTFWGRNVLREDTKPGRALLGNYQHLGLFDGSSMAILSPRKVMRRHNDALDFSHEVLANIGDTLVDRDIAYYQGASHALKSGFMVWKPWTLD